MQVIQDTAPSFESNKAKTEIGMPTSCKDLQLLGHKLNGFYSVKASQPNKQGSKIEAVFCDFPSSSSLAQNSNGTSYTLYSFK